MKLATQNTRNGDPKMYRISMYKKEAAELNLLNDDGTPRDIIRVKYRYGFLVLPVLKVIGTLEQDGITSQICEGDGLYFGKLSVADKYIVWKTQNKDEIRDAFKKAVFSYQNGCTKTV